MVGIERAWALGPRGTLVTNGGSGGSVSRMPLVSRDGTRRTVSQLRTGASALANVLVTGQGPSTALRCRFLTLLTLPGMRNKIFFKSGPQPSSSHQLQDGGFQGTILLGPPVPRPPLALPWLAPSAPPCQAWLTSRLHGDGAPLRSYTLSALGSG